MQLDDYLEDFDKLDDCFLGAWCPSLFVPFIPLQYVDFMSNNWLMLSSYVNTYCVHCCWCWRRHIVPIVELENVKQNFCILRLQCSVNSLLLLVLAYLRTLRSYVGFVLALSAYLLVLLSLLANLTGLAVLVLTSFASHCYFLRHRVFWFWIASIAKCCFIFLTEDGLRIIRNVSK